MNDDITANRHGNDAFSQAAFESTSKEQREKDRRRIIAYVFQHGDATCDEVAYGLGLAHQTASARFSELRRDGGLIWTGEKRRTRLGRWARVHRVNTE